MFSFLVREVSLALINHIHEWDREGEKRDFSYIIGQEFKEKRRLKKVRIITCCGLTETIGQ